MTGLRVLVCGGRDYRDFERVTETLDRLNRERGPVSCVISGGAQGADSWGEGWAELWRIPVIAYPADWKTHGRNAGPIRNARMLAEGKPDLVVAFPGGAGTRDMVRQARAAGVEVMEVEG